MYIYIYNTEINCHGCIITLLSSLYSLANLNAYPLFILIVRVLRNSLHYLLFVFFVHTV